MTEHGLSIKLRIRIIERLAEVDLPGFMFELLDQLLSELNYFKLMNLQNNIEDFCWFLQEISHQYEDTLTHLTSEKIPAYSYHMYEPYLTDTLYEQKRKPSCGLRELLKLKQRCSVIILLSIKEYMYKQVDQQLLWVTGRSQTVSAWIWSFLIEVS